MWRGKNDPWNSFIGGAAVGALAASQRPNPYYSAALVGYFAVPAAVVHYFYDKTYDEMMAAENDA